MRNIDDRFIGYRAEQLAIVRLTDRDDLRLKHADYGVDLLVSVVQSGKESGELFGVQVKGVMTKTKVVDQKGDLRYTVPPGSRKSVANLPFPLLLLVFTMDRDEGFWAWLREPSQDGVSVLTSIPSSVTLSPLDDAALETIVRNVSTWYALRRVDVAA